MRVLAVCHAGLCSPLHVCQFASAMLERDAYVVYLKPESFQKQHVEKLRGIINVTLGVTLVYVGPFEEKWMVVRDNLIEYALENKDMLVEQWDMLRRDQ